MKRDWGTIGWFFGMSVAGAVLSPLASMEVFNYLPAWYQRLKFNIAVGVSVLFAVVGIAVTIMLAIRGSRVAACPACGAENDPVPEGGNSLECGSCKKPLVVVEGNVLRLATDPSSTGEG